MSVERFPAASDGEFDVHVTRPVGQRGPAVVVCHEIFGVTPYLDTVVTRLSEQGYVVFVPDLFWRSGRNRRYDQSELLPALERLGRTNREKVVADVRGLVGLCRDHDNAASGVAVLGFSFGGAIAYLAAAQGKCECAVAISPVGVDQCLDEAPRSPTLLHIGSDDHLVPPDSIAAVRAAADAVAKLVVHEYPAGHGFYLPGSPWYEPDLAASAWRRSLEFIEQYLDPD